MTAPGFCRCGADHPWNATWCFACDKPVLPQPSPAVVPTDTGWPPSAGDITAAIRAREADLARRDVASDPPEYGPDDAEAQRIAEDCADATAEMHWTDEAGGLFGGA